MGKNNLGNPYQDIVNRFLKFENESRVLDYHFQYRNILIWPFIRSTILDSIIKTYLNEEAGLEDNIKQALGKHKIFSYKWSQFFHIWKNPLFCRHRKDIVYLNFSVGNIKDDEGKYYDRVHDAFVELYDNTAIIESAPLFRHLSPRKYKVYESDALDILCLFNEKIARLTNIDRKIIEDFIGYLKTNIPFAIEDRFWNVIEIELRRYAKNNKLVYQYYKKCFTNMAPKLVFVTMGCYGSHAACKIKVLKDLGIPCAEMQHGLTGLSHIAYNFSEIIYRSKEYQNYMPDFFLSFGQYWIDNMRIPIKTYILGSADFSRNACLVKEEATSKRILVLPSDTEPYLDLVAYLAQNFPQKEILVKIHPTLKKQYTLFRQQKASNIKIYIDGDIYEYFRRANIVIGDSSTALYEAAALDRTVLIWNTDRSIHIDKRIGHRFEDKYELVELLKDPLIERQKEKIRSGDIFAPDIETNYLNFIEKYIRE